MRVRACVCACACLRVFARLRACVCLCVCARARACLPERACLYGCGCVRARARARRIPAPQRAVLVQCSFCLKMAAHPPNRTNTYECSMCHELTTVKDAEKVAPAPLAPLPPPLPIC